MNCSVLSWFGLIIDCPSSQCSVVKHEHVVVHNWRGQFVHNTNPVMSKCVGVCVCESVCLSKQTNKQTVMLILTHYFSVWVIMRNTPDHIQKLPEQPSVCFGQQSKTDTHSVCVWLISTNSQQKYAQWHSYIFIMSIRRYNKLSFHLISHIIIRFKDVFLRNILQLCNIITSS